MPSKTGYHKVSKQSSYLLSCSLEVQMMSTLYWHYIVLPV